MTSVKVAYHFKWDKKRLKSDLLFYPQLNQLKNQLAQKLHHLTNSGYTPRPPHLRRQISFFTTFKLSR